MKKWQDPSEADKLMKIEKELLEVKDIIHQNLSDLLKKGKVGSLNTLHRRALGLVNG